MTNLEKLQSIIYERIPELLVVCNQCKKGKFVGVCGRCNGSQKIPQPIQLHHVLMCVKDKWGHLSIDVGGNFYDHSGGYANHLGLWDLSKDLSGQSPEVHTFLLNLLT